MTSIASSASGPIKQLTPPDLILNLRKPIGWSSFDVVRYTKRIWPNSKIGHAGTLDPFAEGVLLVCIGKATKKVGILMEARKAYRAQIRLGLTTDTLDVTGRVIKRHTAPRLDRTAVAEVLGDFVGCQQQKPPIFSAVHVAGNRAYHLARSGKTVDLGKRIIEIYQLDLVDLSEDRLIIDIVCSKGTYVRALARDIASALGTVGYLQSLQRTRVGDYHLRDSREISALETDLANCEYRK